jgi:hypothetical protein
MSNTATATRPARADKEALHSTTAHTAPQTAAPVDKGVSTFELTGLEVTVPNKFAAGDVLDATLASILMTAIVRQFTNNMNANIKARAERLAKATTDAERAANAPYTHDQIVELFANYLPTVGGGPRMGNAEKLRLEAAERAWVALATAHNKLVGVPGAKPVIARAVNEDGTLKLAPLFTPPSKAAVKAANPTLDADGLTKAHKEAVEAFNEERKLPFLRRMLETPAYADHIQRALDAIMAERAAKAPAKPAAAPAAALAVDLL